VRVTVPVNPLRAVKVIVEVPEAPARICEGDTAPGLIEKSTMWKIMLDVVWVREPLVPVTVTV
jgi:hypothetical protein